MCLPSFEHTSSKQKACSKRKEDKTPVASLKHRKWGLGLPIHITHMMNINNDVICINRYHIIFRIGVNIGYHDGIKYIQCDAVQQGYAKWIPDDEGNTTFTWKEGITVTPNERVIEKVPRAKDTPLEPDIPFIDEEMEQKIEEINDGTQ